MAEASQLFERKKERKKEKKNSEIPTFYQNDLAMRKTADVTGGKPMAV
jgi:hypothetical protein